jgi:hypothetical protein
MQIKITYDDTYILNFILYIYKYRKKTYIQIKNTESSTYIQQKLSAHSEINDIRSLFEILLNHPVFIKYINNTCGEKGHDFLWTVKNQILPEFIEKITKKIKKEYLSDETMQSEDFKYRCYKTK